MASKRRASDRVRSRPVQKQSPVKKIKRNKFAIFLVILIVAMLVFSGFYVIFTSLTSNEDNNIAKENPIAVFNTTMGEFRIELYEDKVPITAGNFKDLSESGFYDRTKIHRISPGFMIQGGDPNSKDDDPSDDGFGGPGYTIEDEFHPDLKNERGMISMANSGPDTGGSQFFILVGDASWLNDAHAVFGKVIEGMDIVDEIANMDHDGRYEPQPGGGRPLTDVVINTITIENN